MDARSKQGDAPIVVVDYGNKNNVFAGHANAMQPTSVNSEVREIASTTTTTTTTTTTAEKKEEKRSETINAVSSDRRVDSFDAMKCVFEELVYSNFGWIKEEDESSSY